MNRRSFLALGTSWAALALAGCGRPDAPPIKLSGDAPTLLYFFTPA